MLELVPEASSTIIGPALRKSTCPAQTSSSLLSSFSPIVTIKREVRHTTMAPAPSHLRSLYRSILRELPSRPLSTPSPIQQRIRTNFADSTAPAQVEEAEQYIQYVKAQRMYATLLERYNPGMSMDEEERVRLTARRVGMDLPDEVKIGAGKKE